MTTRQTVRITGLVTAAVAAIGIGWAALHGGRTTPTVPQVVTPVTMPYVVPAPPGQ